MRMVLFLKACSFIVQLIFVRAYLEEVNEGREQFFQRGEGDQLDEEEQLLREVSVYTLASHYFIGSWAITESYTSDLPFGFMVSSYKFIINCVTMYMYI